MTVPMPTDHSIRAGERVSRISVAWTMLASSIAVVAGIERGSLVLIVFAFTGFLDAVGSATLAFHFRHALAHRRISESRERLALRIVGTGLVALGLFTTVESTRRLVTGATAERSPLGIAIAAASIVVLTVLALRKRAIADAVPSKALRADATLSATGAALAVVALLGAALGSGKNLRWVDPVAALVVAVVAALSGSRALRVEEADLGE